MAPRLLTIALALGLALGACRQRIVQPPETAPTAARLAELWVEPTTARDLFHGPGGRELAPDASGRFEVIALKVGGFSEGVTVKDARNREWSVKLPPEAYTEVVASRIHWGIGYHQPPLYFVREWQAEGATAPNPQLPGRFREKNPSFHGIDEKGAWSYYENPFVGTRQMNGLLVLQAMLGNSDLKDSNNSIYELKEPAEGARQWYVARDIGHTFGRTGRLNAARGDIEVFEQTPFIRRIDGDRVELEYSGRHRDLFANLTTADIRWLCRELARLTDAQWRDAFRAAGYEPDTAGRFIRRLKAKIAEGLALPEPRGEIGREIDR
ncbi:MAG TPA: hypothetical protein VFO19_13535 [Vicinamibacterales bacterium]|nr:hypothetical protein [Vicinamibacterales bacterium]